MGVGFGYKLGRFKLASYRGVWMPFIITGVKLTFKDCRYSTPGPVFPGLTKIRSEQ